eukprot:gene4338-4838_t
MGCLEPGTDLEGNDLEDNPCVVGSVQLCRAACATLPACQFFTFTTDGTGKCHLKHSDGG